ncbi:MAG: molybdopterin-dependent oxidoreductase [Treponema sp.]|jgi:xanthine dehydrogenase molybdenum-binding subunit|nr:molybdopterin-dependent oxidoreductase [Treponema sp.]
MKIVGNSYPIHDAEAKATGRAVYAGDMSLPGMLHIAVLFSSIPHGWVRAIDSSKALETPGVVDVLHCLNTKGNVYSRFKLMRGDNPIEQEYVFNEHVRFIGDKIGCVIADKPETARRALKSIKVEYEELPFSVDMHEVRNTGKINNIHSEGAVYSDFEMDIGDKSQIDNNDTIIVSTKTHLSRINHITMEPHACVAAYDRTLGELSIWSPNQAVHAVRNVICEIFEIPNCKVRVIKTTMGGSFGAKQEWMLEPVVAAAALKCGRPVKLVFSRREAMVSTINRCPLDMEINTKISRNGKIQSITADVNLDAGAYLGNSYDYVAAISSKFFRCYSFPYVSYKGRAICTNTPVSGAFRGWTAPETAAAFEYNLNVAAKKIGIDPIELRHRNAAKPWETDRRNGQSLGNIRLRECIELGREKFCWEKKRKEDAQFNNENKRFLRGTAIACGGHVNGYFPRRQDFTGVNMRMTEDGSVLVDVSLHDHGCGTVTAFKMIVAEILGISLSMISIKEADTAITPFDPGCFASRTVYVLGRAVQDCAELLKQELANNVAEINAVPKEFIYIEGATIKCKTKPEIKYSYAQASLASLRILQREVWAKHQYVNNTNPAATAAHFAHVEVDTYTGLVKILDYTAVHDIGQVINREMCIAQVQGAVMMGSGAALCEHNDVKPDGVPVCSLKDYHVLNSKDAPEILVYFIEEGQTEGPFGAKSIGELSHVPVAPVIASAVNDALDSELCHLPINPDKIVAMLRERKVKCEA